MRLLFISLLILNLFFGAWSLQELLSGSGGLQHGVWVVICLATAVICFLELRHQKMSSSLGRPALGNLKKFLEGFTPKEAPTEVADQKREPHRQREPKGEELKQVA